MALTLGTNSGFVTTAPTSDPAESAYTLDGRAYVTTDTSPATAVKITEIGWWCNDASEESNFEVGLYAADGAVVPGEAGTLLEVERTNAKGTTAGWKRVTVDWAIEPETDYWLGVQLDTTELVDTRTDRTSAGGAGRDTLGSHATLPNPAGGGAIGNVNGMYSIYVVWEAVTGTNISINIADTFKDVDSLQINIGDVWKDVTEVQQNIGDVWKTVF